MRRFAQCFPKIEWFTLPSHSRNRSLTNPCGMLEPCTRLTGQRRVVGRQCYVAVELRQFEPGWDFCFWRWNDPGRIWRQDASLRHRGQATAASPSKPWPAPARYPKPIYVLPSNPNQHRVKFLYHQIVRSLAVISPTQETAELS